MKKIVFLLIIIYLALLVPSTVYGQEENADNTYINPIFENLTEQEQKNLTDGNYLTVYKGDKLSVTAEEEFQGLYIIWNTSPVSYTVTADGKTEEFDSEILHQTVKLEKKTKKAEIECNNGEICDIYLFFDLNFPDFVQQWEKPCRQADIMVLPAHADDEFLMFGGAIPYYAKERELAVQVVYLTAHNNEQPRPHEILDGLWAAGVKNYPVIGIIEDIPETPIWTIGEAAQLYDLEAVSQWFTEQLRRFKPSVLVTHDIKGEYGHGAHKLAAKTAISAVEKAGDDQVYPDSAQKYGVWEVPKTYLHFWEENTIEMDWEIPLDSFGGITAREAAAQCYKYHRSQQKYGYAVGYKEKWDCRQFGLYRSLVGQDTKADFMDNIEPLPKAEQTTETETEHVTVPTETEPPKETAADTTAPVITVNEERLTETTNGEQASEIKKIDGIVLPVLIGIGVIGVVAVVLAVRKKR